MAQPKGLKHCISAAWSGATAYAKSAVVIRIYHNYVTGVRFAGIDVSSMPLYSLNMSELGPGPATDIDPGIPNRDLRDEIFMLEGYDPLLEEVEEEAVEDVPSYLEPAPKPDRTTNDYHTTMLVIAGVASVLAWIMLAPVVGVILGIALGLITLARMRQEESG